MKFELDSYHRNTPDAELLADLQRVAVLLGRNAVTMNEQNQHGNFHATTLIRRFGRWPKVLEKAGLQQTRTQMNIPEEELFRNLEELWTKFGRQPRYQDVSKSRSRFSAGTYEKRFGGWRNALQAFIAYINQEERSSTRVASEAASEELAAQRHSSRYINWRLRFIVMRRDHFKCKVCGRTPATDPSVTLDVDHIQAWSKGGRTVLENLQTLCTKCNIGKSDLEFSDSSANEAQNVEV